MKWKDVLVAVGIAASVYAAVVTWRARQAQQPARAYYADGSPSWPDMLDNFDMGV